MANLTACILRKGMLESTNRTANRSVHFSPEGIFGSRESAYKSRILSHLAYTIESMLKRRGISNNNSQF